MSDIVWVEAGVDKYTYMGKHDHFITVVSTQDGWSVRAVGVLLHTGCTHHKEAMYWAERKVMTSSGLIVELAREARNSQI